MALLEVTGLVRRFRGLAAVDDLSFTVDEGQTLAIIGPNGAGKSTTFNLISGLLGTHGGAIRFRGEDITRWPAHRRTRAGVARTFQIVQPLADLDVRDNVMVGVLFGAGASSSLAAARAEAERLCALVGLGDRLVQPVASLTLADRKRLELARALATKPALLLLDEVMEGLTPAEERAAIALLGRVRSAGVTLLLIEHVMSTVRDLSERVVVMDYGKKLAEGTYAEISRDPKVIAAYLGTDDA
ncbi:MAG TPA: ABC transporter ATP-binding protein [Candidatus Acidoferrales bacterium]|nr:ABC transporter ATP-binding protein [Candidatus Acidoferrales bacterium]